MKVKELLELLVGIDLEAELILQKDSEGNGYSPLSGADPEAVYVPTCTWGWQRVFGRLGRRRCVHERGRVG